MRTISATLQCEFIGNYEPKLLTPILFVLSISSTFFDAAYGGLIARSVQCSKLYTYKPLILFPKTADYLPNRDLHTHHARSRVLASGDPVEPSSSMRPYEMPRMYSMVCSTTNRNCRLKDTIPTPPDSPITFLRSAICWVFASRRSCAIWGRRGCFRCKVFYLSSVRETHWWHG
jgi:hypothetical protein